jgi:hypothetical protein
METTTNVKATAWTVAFGVGMCTSAARRRFEGSLALLPVQKLSITGDVRPVTAITFADEHDVRTWSPPV